MASILSELRGREGSEQRKDRIHLRVPLGAGLRTDKDGRGLLQNPGLVEARPRVVAVWAVRRVRFPG